MQETHTGQDHHRPPGAVRKQPGLKRQYFVVALVAIGISLLLSPPRQPVHRTETAQALAGLPEVRSQEALTIRIAQTLGEGHIGIAAKDLRTGEAFALGADETFDAASTMKLVIVGFMYHEASNNRFDLDEVLTLSPGEIQPYGTGTIHLQPAPHRYSWRELARLTMEKSDNTAAYVLAARLDKAKLQRFADEQGLAGTSIAKNTTTPRDLAHYLERFYAGRVADEVLTEELLGILDDSDFEERIPGQLPEETTVYHKTGDAFNGGQHDAGIVVYEGHPYVVAIFTEHVTGDIGLTRTKIAEASRDIFAYYLNR